MFTGKTHLKTKVIPAKRNEMECEQPAGEAGNLYNGSYFLLKGLNISFFIEIPCLPDRQASQPKHQNPSLRRNDDVVKVKFVCPGDV